MSFLATALATSPGGEHVFVAGVDAQGGSVIEHWSYPPRDGGWHVTDNLPADYVGIGNDAPATQTTLGVPSITQPAPWVAPESSKIDVPCLEVGARTLH